MIRNVSTVHVDEPKLTCHKRDMLSTHADYKRIHSVGAWSVTPYYERGGGISAIYVWCINLCSVIVSSLNGPVTCLISRCKEKQG